MAEAGGEHKTLMTGLLGAVLASTAHGQEIPSPTPPPAPTPGAMTEQELAKSLHNPFEDFVKIPIQSTTGFEVSGYHGEALNIAPSVPVALNPQWDVIAQPSLTTTYLPSPNNQFGLGDLQASFFLTPAKSTTWIWGVGPIFQLPTATGRDLGTGRWSAGPTAALIYSKGPWFNGILVYQLMSFAGNHARGSVNQTFLEPDVSYNFDSGWFIQWEPSITYDWTAEAGNAWTVPMGADIGKAFKLRSEDLALQVGAYDLLKRPDGAPSWILRASITFQFPRHTIIDER
jgi:hypothetical protein